MGIISIVADDNDVSKVKHSVLHKRISTSSLHSLNSFSADSEGVIHSNDEYKNDMSIEIEEIKANNDKSSSCSTLSPLSDAGNAHFDAGNKQIQIDEKEEE